MRLLAIETIPGQGIAARLSQESGIVTEVRVGNRHLLQPENGAALKKLRYRIPEGVSPARELFIIEDEHLSALALLTEKLRPAVTSLAPRLRALDLELGIMTGDASPNEHQWAETGLCVSSGLTSAAKAAAVRTMEARSEHPLFVGDGLNDSEAMAAVTASLAIHSVEQSCACSLRPQFVQLFLNFGQCRRGV